MPNATPRLIQARSHGFTLIEVLTAITIASILLGIGIPAFTEVINNGQLAAESNELVTSLSLARSEASKRGIDVSVCPRAGEATCADDTLNWDSGWLVFTDDKGTKGVIDGPDDVVLQSSIGGQSGVAIVSDVPFMTYQPTGARVKAALTVSKPGCKGTLKREISVQLTGRISLAKVAC